MDKLKLQMDKLKFQMDKLKLQWKVFAFLLLFCAMLLIILWLFQTVFLDDMYKFIRKQEIEKAIELVAAHIESPDLQMIIIELNETKEIMVSPTINPGIRPVSRDPKARPPMVTITQDQVFTLSDGGEISLTFHAMVSPVDATVDTLRVQLYIITAVMVLLSVGLAFLLAKRVSKPIVDINESAKVLAAGSYQTQFDGHGFLEIKELSDTLNRAATELSKVERLRRELMANISHDLRTPLALIYSYAEMMHDFPAEITPEQTQTIMDETKRLSSLVNDILDVSRLETGTVELNKSRYNLTQSIKATIDRVAELVKREGYRLFFEANSDVYVNADELKITQALYNLLINAITHGGGDKIITVRQRLSEGFVIIEVADNGEGINPQDLPYIWDRYYKVDKNHKRPIMGTGLGLSIVKKIIDNHGGSYGVSSEVGTGSVFWFGIGVD